MNRLVVSIMIRAGIKGVGVPSGSRWPREVEGWFRRPVNRVASHSGKARAMFIDSWVVGVKVYGRRPKRLMERRNRMSEVNRRAHLWPALFSGFISCFVIRWANQSWIVERRLLIHRCPGEGSRRAGSRRDGRISGMPKR